MVVVVVVRSWTLVEDRDDDEHVRDASINHECD